MRRSAFFPIACLTLLALATACSSIGPKTIPRDQFDYGAAMRHAGKDQLLFNIVGLRYLEAPIFVDISSVINQYSLEGEVALGGGINSSLVGGDSLTLGGSARFADRPTITYTPISGRKFAESLLTPIPPESLFALVQAGWPTELLLRLTVRSINGVENEWASPAHRKQMDPEFGELLGAWSRLRHARALGLRREQGKEAARIIVHQTPDRVTPVVAEDLKRLTEILDLDPQIKEYTMSYGLIPDGPDEIKVLTSSIIELMNELAWRAEVPEEHLSAGRTAESFEQRNASLAPLIRIRHAKERPDQAYVAIRDRDYWYYIDDGDVLSKRTFAILQIILSLTDSGEKARGPVVTVGS